MQDDSIRATDVVMCCPFYELRPLTNGDVIRQGGDHALLRFRYEHRCDICAYAAPIDDAPACRRPDGKVCSDGLLEWLNAPAENNTESGVSEVEDE